MTETMDPFEREEPKKEAERNRVHQLRMIALGFAGVLATLTIALLSARNYFPPTYYSQAVPKPTIVKILTKFCFSTNPF